jgi:hypothetical protein
VAARRRRRPTGMVAPMIRTYPLPDGRGRAQPRPPGQATTHTTPQHPRVAAAAFIESMHARAQAA